MEQAESDQAQIYRTIPRRKVESSGFWDTAIEELLGRGNSFLPLRFSDDGYLFRGMRSGVGAALLNGFAGHFPDTHSMGSLETDLGICFISNELSDALSAAGFDRDVFDAGIFAFTAGVFNDALERGRAGVLAFAEGGLVFKYPFLCQPPKMIQASHLLIDSRAYERICTEPNLNARKKTLESGGVRFVVLEPSSSPSAKPGALGLAPPLTIPGATFRRTTLRPAVTDDGGKT